MIRTALLALFAALALAACAAPSSPAARAEAPGASDPHPWAAGLREPPAALPPPGQTLSWVVYRLDDQGGLARGEVVGPVPSVGADGSLPLVCAGMGQSDACANGSDARAGGTNPRFEASYHAALPERLARIAGRDVAWVVVGPGLVEVARGRSSASSPGFCRGLDWVSVCLYRDDTSGTVEVVAPMVAQGI